MGELVDINYEGIEQSSEYEDIIGTVIGECFKVEELDKTDLYLSITLSDEEYIHKINKEIRNVDSSTDVLSFPMFEKDEISNITLGIQDVLGDIVICIPIVKKQAIEYDHSIRRELAYMLVHGFYHLMGYDHMKDEEKIEMRKKEENILSKLNIID